MEKVLKIAVMLSAIDKMSDVIKGAADQSIKSMVRVNKEADRMARSAFDFGRSAGAFGLAMAAPLGLAVNAAAEYEQMNVALKTAFQGNEAAAEAAFNQINEFAAKTPYEMSEVMTSFIKLKNMGLDPSIEALTAYGNTASGMGKSLNDMVEAVADAATGEFERLKEFGIRASSEGDNVKFTFQGVTTTVGKNSKEIEEYLKNIGLTKFAGGIEAQSKTFKGQLSTLKDNVNMFAAKIGEKLIPALIQLFEKIKPVLDAIGKWMDRNPTLTRYIIMGAAAVAGLSLAASALAFVFGGLMKVVQAITVAVRIFSGVIRVGTSVFRVMTSSIRIGRTVIMAFRGGVVSAIRSLWSMITATRVQTLTQKIFSATMTFGTTVMYATSTAVKFVGSAFKQLTRIMKANPIILILSLIAEAVFWIIDAWDGIVDFFVDLWNGVKKPFVAFWDWVKGWVMKPIIQIQKAWDKLKQFFPQLWESIKKPFVDFYNWIMSLGSRFVQAGANIVNSIGRGFKNAWEGIKKWWSDSWKELREYLPFSPAKRGPLRDIHRVKIIETIAQTIKPDPLRRAMEKSTMAIKGAIPKPTGLTDQVAYAGAGGSGGIRGVGGMTVNFSPTINIQGGGGGDLRDSIMRALKEYEPELMRLIKGAAANSERRKLS